MCDFSEFARSSFIVRNKILFIRHVTTSQSNNKNAARPDRSDRRKGKVCELLRYRGGLSSLGLLRFRIMRLRPLAGCEVRPHGADRCADSVVLHKNDPAMVRFLSARVARSKKHRPGGKRVGALSVGRQFPRRFACCRRLPWRPGGRSVRHRQAIFLAFRWFYCILQKVYQTISKCIILYEVYIHYRLIMDSTCRQNILFFIITI